MSKHHPRPGGTDPGGNAPPPPPSGSIPDRYKTKPVTIKVGNKDITQQLLTKKKRAVGVADDAKAVSVQDEILLMEQSAVDPEFERRSALLSDRKAITDLVREADPVKLGAILNDVNRTALTPGEQKEAKTHLLNSLFQDEKALCGLAMSDPGVVIQYLAAADEQKMDLGGALKVLTPYLRTLQPALLTSRLARRRPEPDDVGNDSARSPDGVGRTLHDWMWTRGVLDVTTEWNDRSRGLAAQAFNGLWNAGNYGLICDLIKAGLDTTQFHTLPKNTGRGDKKQDGVWSGNVQPLEHVLCKYLKRVQLLKEGKIPDSDPDLERLKGARQVLDALAARTPPPQLLTSYEDVKKSQALAEFLKEPGTFWGFEDVRMPYVEAARETKNGQRVLRMMDLWDVIQGAVTPTTYPDLLKKPSSTIPGLVETGVQAAKDAFEAKRQGKRVEGSEMNYDGLEEKAYIRAFEQQATSFLEYLSRGDPEAKMAVAELTGKDAGKAMGALACKAGLWWAKRRGEPVYYCLDGINLDDVANYKKFKTQLINTTMERKAQGLEGGVFNEVITLAELREILREENWPRLQGTVRFVEKGKILEGADLKRIHDVQAKMAEVDKEAKGTRTRPAKAALNPLAKELALDPLLFADYDEETAAKVVTKAKMLEMAAAAKHTPLLIHTLKDSAVLFENGVLPRDLLIFFEALATDTLDAHRKSDLDNIDLMLDRFPQMSPLLREALQRAAFRISINPPMSWAELIRRH